MLALEDIPLLSPDGGLNLDINLSTKEDQITISSHLNGGRPLNLTRLEEEPDILNTQVKEERSNLEGELLNGSNGVKTEFNGGLCEEALISSPVKEEKFGSEESSRGDSFCESSERELKSEPDLEPEFHPEPGTSGSATPCALTVLSSDSDSSEDGGRINRSRKRIKSRKHHNSSPSGGSCSSSSDEIDYNNLTPEEIKALVEEARRIRAIKKKCKCPKKRWEDLPVKGPTKSSGKCTIGKGDWSESNTSCAYCSSGIAHRHHVPRDPWQLERHPQRSRRRKIIPTRLNIVPLTSADRVRATVAGDIPIVELISDDENSPPVVLEGQITVTPSDSVIVLSSDDDEIVCEKVVKPTVPVAAVVEPEQVVIEPEPWPEPNIDLGNWDEAFNLLADLCGPSNLGGGSAVDTEPRPRAATPPEEWSCPICLESKSSVPEIMSTVCGHIFCAECIRSAVRVHHKCPTCRKKLTIKQFHKIFL